MQAETEKMWTGISQEYLRYWKSKSWNQEQGGGSEKNRKTVFQDYLDLLQILVNVKDRKEKIQCLLHSISVLWKVIQDQFKSSKFPHPKLW